MKFHLGEAPKTADFTDASKWTLVTMPEIRRWQLMALPVAIINMGLVAALWLLLTPAIEQFGTISFPLPILNFVLCLVGVLIVHEFIHAFMHPSGGLSKQSIIGFYPSRMLLYSIYNGEVNRNRFLVTLMMPFIIISFVPIILSVAFQSFSFWLAYITVLNAFVAAGDILETVTILKQVPKDSKIRRNGWDYYWYVSA